MVKTRELYYEDQYMSCFDSEVISCEKGGDGLFYVVLERTAFFPEQGGQSSDTGIIERRDKSKVRVLHTSIQDGIITHRTDGALTPGEIVHGEIDFEHRFSNMQQHTGEHIFSGVVRSRLGYENVGFHLSDSEVTMDYSGPISDSEIKEIELIVNRAIWENVPVRCGFPSDEELANMDYRSKKELSGDIRIVTIEGYDVCACCAPHVRNSGEIGLLKVIKTSANKGGVRVSILCGKRALEYLDSQQKLICDLIGLLTTGQDKIYESVKRLIGENALLRGDLSSLRRELIDYELENIDETLSDVFLVKEDGLDGNIMKSIVNKLSEKHGGYCGVFSGSDDKGYRYMVVSREDNRDAGNIQQILSDEYSARGGGKPNMIQGSIPSVNIADVIEKIRVKTGQ